MTAGHPSVRALLDRHGLHPKKRWGQNFLKDPNVLRRIARAAELAEGERVVELGAGLGHLTAALVETGAEVVAVERDRDLIPVLEEVFEGEPRVRVVPADAKKVDVEELAGGERVAVVGNLPYHLTSSILFHLLDQRERISRIVVMVQKEVAERLAAEPGNKDYGVLSVRFQLHARVRLVFDVPAGAFVPPPQVTSSVLRLDFRDAPLADPGDEALFARVVKGAFAQRRKTVRNSLKAARLVSDEDLDASLAEAGIDPRGRPETVPVEGYAALCRSLGARMA